jgi:hypothetical protein
VPTLPIVGSLIKAGVRVLIYRYLETTEPKLFLIILWLELEGSYMFLSAKLT